MAKWEDYYAILAVNPNSSAEEIKVAYRYKTNILHPDRLMQAPKSVRHQAEDELKKVELIGEKKAKKIKGIVEKEYEGII